MDEALERAVTETCSFDPYWWRAAPPPESVPEALPRRCDVAIVGSGITGTVAALDLARGGRHVVVLEKAAAGAGASSRNAGYVGRTLKHGFGELMDRHGLPHAKAVYGELMEAFVSVREMIADEGIACHYRQQGRFLMATSASMFSALESEFALREEHLGEPFAAVGRAAQGYEVATRHYHGGIVIPDHAGLHPGLYIAGIRDRTRAAGAEFATQTEVLSTARESQEFLIVTTRGPIVARDLIVATNGYTGGAVPWLQRRVMSFDAYQTVSEPLGRDVVEALLPSDRTYIDWNFNVDWFRKAADDDTRIIFGGLTGGIGQDLRKMAVRLKERLVRIFPQLTNLRFDHVWTGKCAGTFDLVPHLGNHDGVHYGLGYCFAGVPMGTLFGRKLARRVLGKPGGGSVFDAPPPAIPFYTGNPWFVPYAIRWMSRQDL